jgi:hypothetical protein
VAEGAGRSSDRIEGESDYEYGVRLQSQLPKPVRGPGLLVAYVLISLAIAIVCVLLLGWETGVTLLALAVVIGVARGALLGWKA